MDFLYTLLADLSIVSIIVTAFYFGYHEGRMTIQIAENREEWNGHLIKSDTDHQFLQSWEWGEFQREVGHEPVRLRVVEEGATVDQVQGFIHHFPLGMRYMYVPRFACSKDENLLSLLDYFKKTGVMFVRLEPASGEVTQSLSHIFSTGHRQPAHTLLMDLREEETQLLGKMHAKTRYNIHLARRKGVEIREEKNHELFWMLYRQTTQRDEFRGHTKTYYKKMLESSITRQLIAYYQDQPIATMILIIFGNTATYLHGASGNTHRDVMAPYLLQWEAMKLAKSHECERYDFWGVSGPVEKDDARAATFHNYTWDGLHKFSSVTRFKSGFGGTLATYPPACEWTARPKLYALYRMVKKVL